MRSPGYQPSRTGNPPATIRTDENPVAWTEASQPAIKPTRDKGEGGVVDPARRQPSQSMSARFSLYAPPLKREHEAWKALAETSLGEKIARTYQADEEVGENGLGVAWQFHRPFNSPITPGILSRHRGRKST